MTPYTRPTQADLFTRSYRRGVTHRMRKHYSHARARGVLSDIARHDRDQTTERVEVSERVQDAMHMQNR